MTERGFILLIAGLALGIVDVVVFKDDANIDGFTEYTLLFFAKLFLAAGSLFVAWGAFEFLLKRTLS